MQHKSYMLRFPLTCKLKLKTPFYFIFCKFYVAARGFEKRTVSILRKQATTPIHNCLYYTPVGALHCKHLRIANAERQTHPQPLYMVQAICQAWNQSRVN